MTKRFELKTNFLNGHVTIIDWVESEQKDAICIFNDLGVLPFSSAPSLCNLLNQLNDENDQLKQKVDFYKYFQKDARELEKENEQLKEEIKGLNDILARYKEKELKERIDNKKSCGHCKHFEIDGMFGLWCEKGHDWTSVEYCSDYEKGL
ncbi:hypothetical protein [uncultured Methanobrevibacter sp.]|uniref:hypothetical protein n=1 Tax=uncultured Methanobrevibacter sp. TaxID=253161 RepID=UPI0025ED0BCE|nr:hypothetical protein [uncultured Methanobrevibacter sp.]